MAKGFPNLALFFLLSCFQVLAKNKLSSTSYSLCDDTNNENVRIDQFMVEFDESAGTLVFDISGSSQINKKITAVLEVFVFGEEIYSNKISPCDYNIIQLCPLPSGPFSGKGSLEIPESYIKNIPDIAFAIPNLEGTVKLRVYPENKVDSTSLVCIQTKFGNNKSLRSVYVSWAAFGVTIVAAGVTAVSGFGSSPSVFDILEWFHFIAFAGLFSVEYPSVMRAFSSNFGWSLGIVSIPAMQRSLDKLITKTGANMSTDSYESLIEAIKASQNMKSVLSNRDQRHATQHSDFSHTRRELAGYGGGFTFSSNRETSQPSDDNNALTLKNVKNIQNSKGIQKFVEELKVPSASTFLTVLLMFLIVLASVIAIVLAIKAVLELLSRKGKLSKKWDSFRRHYLQHLAGIILRIVLFIYSTWVLFCMYQFKNSKSWVASLLAGITLVIFTLVLFFYTFRIFQLARQAKKLPGGIQELYQNKPWMRKYGFFYDQFKSKFWWFFAPLLVYGFMRSAFVALGQSKPLLQAVGAMTCEVILFLSLIISFPFDGRKANILNIAIAITRILSIGCILVFVNAVGVGQTQKTAVGIFMMVMQSLITAVLLLLLIYSAIISLVRKKPIKDKNKEMEKNKNGNSIDGFNTEKAVTPQILNMLEIKRAGRIEPSRTLNSSQESLSQPEEICNYSLDECTNDGIEIRSASRMDSFSLSPTNTIKTKNEVKIGNCASNFFGSSGGSDSFCIKGKQDGLSRHAIEQAFSTSTDHRTELKRTKHKPVSQNSNIELNKTPIIPSIPPIDTKIEL